MPTEEDAFCNVESSCTEKGCACLDLEAELMEDAAPSSGDVGEESRNERRKNDTTRATARRAVRC